MRKILLCLLCFCSIGLYAQEISPDLEAKLRQYIKFDPEGSHTVGHIIIEDRKAGINQGTWLYVKTALDHYKETKPIFIILELNTPGGEVFSSQRISDALKEMDTQLNIPVVAFVNNWAISAGAMLAYSCRFITIVKDASMGAAEPVLAGQSGQMQTASEKVNSALRADFGNRANFFDRNPDMAEAMVDKDIILVYRKGQIVRLDKEEQIVSDDTIITAKGKLLTLNAEQQIKYGVADILMLPEPLDPITPQEEDAGKWPAEKMLLFQQSFFNEIPNATIDSFQMDLRTRFFVMLAHPVVASFLFLGLMVGFYVEINTPGFGVPGTIGLTCLFLLILSSFALEVAHWLEIILFGFGIVCILAEVFVTPGFGLLGVIGVISFLAGLFGMMIPGLSEFQFDFDTQTLNAAGQAAVERIVWLAGTLVIAAIIIVLLARYVLPKFSHLSRLVLVGEEDKEKGYVAGADVKTLPQQGSKGIASSTLRPAGKILIDDKLFDAMSDGEFIEEGEKIVVMRLEGSRIIVDRPLTGEIS